MQTLPDYHLDPLFRAALEEEAEALASTAVSESQMLERVGRALARRRTRRQLATLLLAAALTTLAAAAFALGGNRPTPPVTPERSPEASATPEGSLPALRLPGTSRRAGGYLAGEYGWTGALGSFNGMHSVIENPSSPWGFRQTQLTFAVEDDCFAYGTDSEPEPVTVAGLDGLYVEPYEDPAVQFAPNPQGAATTGAYGLGIGDRTLCLYLTWDAATTPDELNAAREVLESIRGQPFGEDGIRIIFTLPAGWDTG
jgi:hypothetical protein